MNFVQLEKVFTLNMCIDVYVFCPFLFITSKGADHRMSVAQVLVLQTFVYLRRLASALNCALFFLVNSLEESVRNVMCHLAI